ncbi:MAG: hypothetical protein VW268_12825 [Rhodospirillaceae bacterium]
MTRRQFSLMICAALALTGLNGCGRKNQPKHPTDSDFPREYPYAPAAARQARDGKANALPPPEPDQFNLVPNTTFRR